MLLLLFCCCYWWWWWWWYGVLDRNSLLCVHDIRNWMRSVLTHLCRVDSSTLTLSTGPFPISGVSGQFLLLSCSVELSELNANSVDPDQTPRSAASDLGLHCLPLTLLWDARLKWVKYENKYKRRYPENATITRYSLSVAPEEGRVNNRRKINITNESTDAHTKNNCNRRTSCQ